MAIEQTGSWQPEWAVAPGEVLLEVLQERRMTQSELARRMGRPLKTINEIIKGKAALTAETSIQLERALGIRAAFWNNLEATYRGTIARRQAALELDRESVWASKFPIKELRRWGKIGGRGTNAEAINDLLSFFRVSSRQTWEEIWSKPVAVFRGSKASAWKVESVAAWLRWGEADAEQVSTKDFDEARFRQALKKIRSLTAREPFSTSLDEAIRLCADAGVVLIATPELPGAPISGAARWLTKKRALIQVSLRYKSQEQFWFSFFHEAGHLLSDSVRRREFVDVVDSDEDDADEVNANQFARNELIPSSEWEGFTAERDFSPSTVRAFAHRLGISPGIVVGRLQRDDFIGAAQLNGLKRPLKWAHRPPSTYP